LATIDAKILRSRLHSQRSPHHNHLSSRPSSHPRNNHLSNLHNNNHLRNNHFSYRPSSCLRNNNHRTNRRLTTITLST
ncbi:hypothetical protein LPJ59_005251, partial [Coemansia sp. RSA 2399]